VVASVVVALCAWAAVGRDALSFVCTPLGDNTCLSYEDLCSVLSRGGFKFESELNQGNA
jgi:hypothetical protein